jgi:hypothetical protein
MLNSVFAALLAFAVFAIMTKVVSNRSNRSDSTNEKLDREVRMLQDSVTNHRFKKLGFTFVLPSALIFLRLINFKQFCLTFWKKAETFDYEERDSKVFAIFAIYEKGNIRNDVMRALEVLADLNYSIILVNSRKLNEESRVKISKVVFSYIERPNYGRDFGSYKDGFLWLYKKHRDKYLAADRLLFLNDSVYYSRNSLSEFFKLLRDNSVDALGATINHDRYTHIGSFCLSVGPAIIARDEFVDYWKKYRKTDLRPNTIKNGELKLSRTISRISSGDLGLHAIYSQDEISRRLHEDENLLRTCHNASRRSAKMWQAVRPNIRVSMIREDTLINPRSSNAMIEQESVTEFFAHADSFDDGYKAFKYGVSGDDSTMFANYKKFMASFIGNDLHRGSPIHIGSTILPYLGCPIIKLDLEFRGVIDTYDRLTICSALEPEDAKEFAELSSSRPYGGWTLSGWKLAAFFYGYL